MRGESAMFTVIWLVVRPRLLRSYISSRAGDISTHTAPNEKNRRAKNGKVSHLLLYQLSL